MKLFENSLRYSIIYKKFFIDIVASIHYSEDINDTKILLGICSCLLKNTIGIPLVVKLIKER